MGMMKRKPNSYAIVTVTGGNRNGLCLGKTDIVTTQQNPYYCKIIVLETTASEYLPIKVHIFDHAMHYAMDYSAAGTTTYDNDALKRPYNRYDLEIAAANFEITEIVQSPGRLMCQSSINNDKIKYVYYNV